MKKTLLILLLIPAVCIGQDWGKFKPVANKNEQFGQAIKKWGVVLCMADTSWYIITDLASSTDSLQTFLRQGKYYRNSSGDNADSKWESVGSDIYYSAGKVSIGSSSPPDSTLKVTGGVNVTRGLNVGYDIKVNGVTIGKGKGVKASNTAVGVASLSTITSGQYNTAVGHNSQKLLASGSNNTSVGDSALYTNTNGGNTAIGSRALLKNTAASNTAVGAYSMWKTTSGSNNSALGYNSLCRNTSGQYNVSVGEGAMFSNTTGAGNIGIGRWALYYNTTTSYNVAVGYDAIGQSTSGRSNTALGVRALYLLSSGNNNIALGDSAGYAYTTLSNRMYLGARDTTGTTGGIYFDRTPAKRWGKWMGTLKVTNIPADDSPDSVLTVVDGLIKRAAFPTGGSGTVTSISQGTGMLNSADPITTTGTIGVDTSKVVMFTDTAATGGKIATSYALTTGLAGKQAAGSYVTSVGATSPVASSGGTTPTVSINTDTLTAWHTKQNQGATAYGWGNHAIAGYVDSDCLTTTGDMFYKPAASTPECPADRLAIGSPGQLLGVVNSGGSNIPQWQDFAAYDTATNPWKYLSGNTVQRGSGNVGIGTTNPTALLFIENASQGAIIRNNSTVSIPAGSGTYNLSQLDLLHNGTTGVFARQVLRYNRTTSRYEFMQSFRNTSGGALNVQYLDLDNGSYQIQSGVTNMDFQNTGNVTFSNSGSVGIATTSPSTYLDINGNKFRLRTAKTPSSSTDTGNAGDICWDASYIYICTATNTWKRVAISTW